METLYKYTFVVLLAAMAAIGVFKATNSNQSAQLIKQTPPASSSSIRATETALGQVAGTATNPVAEVTVKPAPKLLMPLSFGMSRITKKTFGLYVSPAISPVNNDIFVGFHTGIDFETYASEQNTDVVITAACDGIVLAKEWAKGYGGVIVQSCKIDGGDLTVIYGHLKLESITSSLGQTLQAGDKIGYLGQGGTLETDGRRKHLHFDIHKGTEINILGYVPMQEDLANWIDPVPYLE